VSSTTFGVFFLTGRDSEISFFRDPRVAGRPMRMNGIARAPSPNPIAFVPWSLGEARQDHSNVHPNGKVRKRSGTVPDAPWLAELEAELFAFPHGPHDDQVDSISQALGHETGFYDLKAFNEGWNVLSGDFSACDFTGYRHGSLGHGRAVSSRQLWTQIRT
jgi:hypothetical protein